MTNLIKNLTSADIEKFRETYWNIEPTGGVFVLICDMRRALDWSREMFDCVLAYMRARGAIQLHKGCRSYLGLRDQLLNYKDENDNIYSALSFPDYITINLYPDDIAEFKEKYDELEDKEIERRMAIEECTGIYVKIGDMRRALDWSPDRFDNVLRYLKSEDEIILGRMNFCEDKDNSMSLGYSTEGITFNTLSWSDKADNYEEDDDYEAPCREKTWERIASAMERIADALERPYK